MSFKEWKNMLWRFKADYLTQGSVEQIAADKYKISGIINQLDATTLEVTELPVGVWTQTYKEFLEGLLVGKENVEPFIKV